MLIWWRTSSGGHFTYCDEGGAFGLIATNTIGQGDTRSYRAAVDLHAMAAPSIKARQASEVAGRSGGGR